MLDARKDLICEPAVIRYLQLVWCRLFGLSSEGLSAEY